MSCLNACLACVVIGKILIGVPDADTALPCGPASRGDFLQNMLMACLKSPFVAYSAPICRKHDEPGFRISGKQVEIVFDRP